MKTPHKHLLKELSAADLVTLFAVFLIVCSFWMIWLNQLYLGIAVAFISMFFDYLDGAVARKYGGSVYGKVFDSLYDVLGWVLFPSLIINIQAGWNFIVIAITTLFCVAAIMRLGRFTVEGYVESDTRYYLGLPVLFSKYALLVSPFFHATLSAFVLLAMIPLMVSSRLIKKPHPIFAQLELLYALIFFYLYVHSI